MKIVIDARMYGLENAGIGRYLINLLNELEKIDSKSKYIVLLRKKYCQRLKLNNNFKKIEADFRHYSFAEQIKLPGILSKYKSALFHFPHFNIPVNFKGRFVVTLHDMTMHKQGRGASKLNLPFYYLKRPVYKFIYKKAVNDSKKIIVPTRQIKNELIEYFNIDKKKVSVIYEGLSSIFAEIASSRQQEIVLKKYKLASLKYFIYVGNVYPHKNIKRAIEAIGFLNRKNVREYMLAIVSSRGVFTKRLQKIISELGAHKSVKLLGFVEDKELSILLRNSRAFVYPSLSEGFGLPGLEAMSAGTLVFASDIPVFREVYGKNAIYFNPFDFTAIAKAIEEAAEIKEKTRIEKIARAQHFIKRYSWSKMAKQTLKLYDESCIGLRSGK